MGNQARKVGIVGVSHVGSHCAYNIAIQGIADELILCDTNQELAEAQAKDLTDSAVYFPHRIDISTGLRIWPFVISLSSPWPVRFPRSPYATPNWLTASRK